jgi:two-component system, chemotaxis family, chemotaxis protein CheY
LAARPDTAVFVADHEQLRTEEFFSSVRDYKFAGNRYLPIIVALWQPSIALIRHAIAVGAHEIVSMPANAEAMSRAIYRAVFVGRPFVDVPAYFGPCRRRKQIQNYGQKNRRKLDWDYSHISVR